MAYRWRVGVLTTALSFCAIQSAEAAPITFDLEALGVGTFTAFSQTVDGVTATFSSPLDITGPRFSVQNQSSTGFVLSQFSANYIYPNGLGVAPLHIVFSRPVHTISLTFATVESHIASSMTVSAYLGATLVGSVSASGAYLPGDTYPQGTVTFGGAAFDRVALSVPPQGTEPAVAFLVDSIVVDFAPAPVQQANWTFEEGGGQTATDVVGGYVGQLGSTTGADANDPVWTPGRTGGGLSFAGAQYVTVPTTPGLAPGTIAVEAWVRSGVAHGIHEYVVARGADATCSAGAYGLRTGENGGLEFIVFGPAGAALVSPESAATIWNGRWHFVTGTFDGLTAHVFIDGVEVASGTRAGAPFTIDYSFAPDQRLAIGSYLGGSCGPGTRSFAGDIDQVSIWNGALTAAQVAQRFAELNLPYATVTTLTATPAGTSRVGEPVVLSANVTSNDGTPVGSVEFFDGGSSLGTMTLTGGAAQITVTTLLLGAHTLSASFTPTAGFTPSDSAPLTHTVVAGGASETATALSSSLNPSVYTEAVTLTATVTVTGGGAADGVVQFFDGRTLAETVALSGGVATLTPSNLPVGTHSFTAHYMGTADFAPSQSTAVAQVVVKANTATTLVSAPPAPCGFEAVTLTATVAMIAPASGVPAGDVRFYDGTTLIGTAPLSAGQAVLTSDRLGIGTHTIRARYVGTTELNASESSALGVTVNPAATITVVTSSHNPAALRHNVAVWFTATVAAVVSGAGTPTGIVSFYDNGVLIGSKKLQGGSVTVMERYKTAGSHTITAVYGGSTAFGVSTSLALTQVVE